MISVAALVSISMYAYGKGSVSDESLAENAEALAGARSAQRIVCYSQYLVHDSMRCLECVTCEYVNGAGFEKGGYCSVGGL